jgi:ankyrin repeat protein
MPEFPEEKKNDLLIEYAVKGATGGALMALQAGADVNHMHSRVGQSALHCAAINGHEALAQRLLGAGADIKAADYEGNSCLHIAAAQGSNEILRILLNAGAKVSAKNQAGYTALQLAQNAQTIDVLKGAGAKMPKFPNDLLKKNDLLIEYAQKGATGGVLMALQAGADVNHKDEHGWTPLHLTARSGDGVHCWSKSEVAKVLLANGAQVNARTNDGRTALAVARRWGLREMEALLLQHGAE